MVKLGSYQEQLPATPTHEGGCTHIGINKFKSLEISSKTKLLEILYYKKKHCLVFKTGLKFETKINQQNLT